MTKYPSKRFCMKKFSIVLSFFTSIALICCGVFLVNDFANDPTSFTVAEASNVLWTDPSALGSTDAFNNENLTNRTNAGTVSNTPFQIANASQLALLAKRVNDNESFVYNDTTYYYSQLYYEITANINLGAYQWVPIGTADSPFGGYFDGNSDAYSITNLTRTMVNSTDSNALYYGLFGYVDSSVIRGQNIFMVHLQNTRINITTTTGQALYVGSVIGYISSNTQGKALNNVYTDTGEIIVNASSSTSNAYIGGLVGYTAMDITGASSNMVQSNLSISYTGADIDNLYIGGLAGYSTGAISYAQAQGSISSAYGTVGGVAGYAQGACNYLTSSTAITVGDADGSNDRYAGGLVGIFNPSSSATFQRGTYSGTITAKDYNVGGLIGQSGESAVITNNCQTTNSASINLADYSNTNTSSIGGLVGQNLGQITSARNYANITKESATATTDKMINVGGVAGVNTGAIARIDSTYNYGNITNNVRAANAGGIVGVNNSTYGDGSTTYSITACANFGNINGMSAVGGIAGNNQNGSIYGSVNYNATISGRFLDSSMVGGITGTNQGTIKACFNTGTIGPIDSASQRYTAGAAGGISGSNSGSGVIQYCYSMANITGQATTIENVSGITAGGLVGINTDATLEYSYAIGITKVDGNGYVGGVVGQAAGNTGNIHNVYYNNEVTDYDGNTTLAIGNAIDIDTVMGVESWELVSQRSGTTTITNSLAVDLGYDSNIWAFRSPNVSNGVYSYPYINYLTTTSIRYSETGQVNSTDQFMYPTATIYNMTIQSESVDHPHDTITQMILQNYKADEPDWADTEAEKYKYSVVWRIGTQGNDYWDFDTMVMDSGNKNIYAIWSPQSYTIVYHIKTPTSNGIVLTDDAIWHQQYTDNQVAVQHTYDTATYLPTMNKFVGHEFGGWYYDADYMNEVTSAGTNGIIAADVYFTTDTFHVYGEWTAETYDITLNTVTVDSSTSGYFNDGQPSDNRTRTMNVQVTFGETYDFNNRTGETTEVLSETGEYIFAGWFLSDGTKMTDRYGNSEFNGEANTWNIDVNSSGDGTLTLYARYVDAIQKVYFVDYRDGANVNLVVNGGLDYIEVPYEEQVQQLDKDSPLLNKSEFRTGNTIANWYVDQDLTILFDFENTDIVETTTIYAGWRAVKYTLTFDKNNEQATSGLVTESTGEDKGGTDGVAYNTSIFTVATTTENTTPTCVGYNFDGWYIDQECNTPVTTATVMPEGGMTIYAKWNIKSFNIRLNANGGTLGSISELPNKVNYGSTYVIYLDQLTSAELPTRSGYGFVGWSLRSGDNYETGKMSTSDYINTPMPDVELSGNTRLTVYAVWRVQYTITFDAAGGSTVEPLKVWDNETISEDTLNVLCATSLSGWIFDGWFIVRQDDNGNEILTNEELTTSTVIDENLKVEAKWTLDPDAGYVAPDNTTPLIIAGVILGVIAIALGIIIFTRRKGKDYSLDEKSRKKGKQQENQDDDDDDDDYYGTTPFDY